MLVFKRQVISFYLKLCLATATHNIKRLSILTYRCTIWIKYKTTELMLISFSNFLVPRTNRKAESCDYHFNYYNAKIDFYINRENQKKIQFEIIVNVLVSSFCYISILVLWVYVRNILLFQCSDRL